MPKGGVLGNDPFRRGAAVRDAEPEPEKAPDPPKKKRARKAGASAAEGAAPKRAKKAPARSPAPEPVPDGAGREQPAHDEPPSAAEAPAEVAPASPSELMPDERSEEGADPAGAGAAAREHPDEAVPEPAEEPPDEEDDEARPASEEMAEAVAHAVRESEPGSRSGRTTLFDHMAGEQPAGPIVSRALGALAIARDVAAQTLRTEGVARLAKIADGVFSAVMTAVGASGAREVDPYGKDEELARKLAPISDFFYDRYWRVTVEGAPLVPAGASILVANHSGAIPIDGFILHQALHKERPDLPEARWLTEDQIFHAPFVGTLYNRLGAIRASPDNAVRLLREGRPVITFPEGIHGIRKPFQERYQLKRLGRGGFAKIAIRERIPIVPVAIVGAEEAMPLLGKLPGEPFGLPYIPLTVPPLPARWYIRFGEPIRVDALPPQAADDLLEVQRVVERTRENIEGMIRALLQDRRSVFGG